jgi:hypothetical protein
MRPRLSTLAAPITIAALLMTFAAPASAAAAGDRPASPAPATEPLAPSTGAPSLVSNRTLNQAIARASAELVTTRANRSQAPQPARAGASAKRIRAQGGGKGQMITMMVSTVVGLAATVYTLKYIQDQQKKNADQ